MRIRASLISLMLLPVSCAATSGRTRAASPSACFEPSGFVEAVCPLRDGSMTPAEHLEAWRAARIASSHAWNRDPADRQAAIAFSIALVHAVQAQDPEAACQGLFAVANYSYQSCAAQSHQVRGLMRCQLGRLIESCRQSTESVGNAFPESREETVHRAMYSLVVRPCRPGEPGYRP